MYLHCFCINVAVFHLVAQSSDDAKGEEEEGAAKVIPKWKAMNITEIIIEPELEGDEEEEEIKAVVEEQATAEDEEVEPAQEEQGTVARHGENCGNHSIVMATRW